MEATTAVTRRIPTIMTTTIPTVATTTRSMVVYVRSLTTDLNAVNTQERLRLQMFERNVDKKEVASVWRLSRSPGIKVEH